MTGSANTPTRSSPNAGQDAGSFGEPASAEATSERLTIQSWDSICRFEQHQAKPVHRPGGGLAAEAVLSGNQFLSSYGKMRLGAASEFQLLARRELIRPSFE